MSCLSKAKFLIIINGNPVGFFSSTQGVRKGDPLSPFLFIIMVESLRRYILSRHSQNLWQGVQIPNTKILVTHSIFTNDTLLFNKSLVT